MSDVFVQPHLIWSAEPPHLANASRRQIESLEKAIDAPIRVLYMKQLLLLRDKVRVCRDSDESGVGTCMCV